MFFLSSVVRYYVPMFASRPTVVGSPRTFIAGMMALAVLLTVGCSPMATPTVARHESALDASVAADIERLLGLMRQRLLIMHEVARWKWHHRQPITDTVREAELLERTDQRVARARPGRGTRGPLHGGRRLPPVNRSSSKT